MTDKLFPDHTCCVIAGNNEYTSANEGTTVKFLAAYVKSVDKLKDVIAQGSGTEYDSLITLTAKKTGLDSTKEADRTTIAQALKTIKYTYNDAVADLATLKSNIADLVVKYEAGGVTKNKVTDLGFKNANELANKFVKDKYLKKALTENASDAKKATVTVAVISGDIHQIGLHYGVELGYFAQYGITVELSPQNNGPGVATALQNGDAKFGLLGAPPVTIISINSKLITGN